MATTITHLKVFIASPSDLNEERNVVKQVVNELNIIYPNHYGIFLDILTWEENTYPAFGEDGQDVINKQIPEYDIFIGMMWSRFGTPTKRFSSGTKEEFERAYLKYQSNSNEVFILFYFKDEPIAPSDLDIHQITEVLKFKQELISKGGLLKTFKSVDDFAALLRVNLAQVIGSYLQNLQLIENEKTSFNDNDLEDELGMYEHIDMGANTMSEFSSILNNITNYTNELSDKMTVTTAEMQALSSKPEIIQEGEGRRLIDKLSSHLLYYADRVKLEIPILNTLFEETISHLTQSIVLLKSINPDIMQNDNITKLKEDLSSFKEKITNGITEVDGFKDIINSFPSLTTNLSRAKKQTIKVLKDLVIEFNSEVNLVNQLFLSFEN